MEFLAANELSILRWVHIIAMVYWLGGEWGVFQTSYHVTNRKLSLEERKRHMETAYRIDILARTGIVLLLPLGLHMGKLYGFVPFLEGNGIWWMWLLFITWLAMTWTAFIKRETDIGIVRSGLIETRAAEGTLDPARLRVLNKVDLLEPAVAENICRLHEAFGVSALERATLRPLPATMVTFSP